MPAKQEPLVGVPAARLSNFRAEYVDDAFGIGSDAPRLSWMLNTDDVSWQSDRYEIELTREDGAVEVASVQSAEQVFVPWPFEKLNSREALSLRVRVGARDRWTGFSESLAVEVGLLDDTDWHSSFVSPASIGGLEDGAPLVFTDVDLPSAPRRARLYVTSLGLYEFSINGSRVGRDVLTPGWTAYHHRLRYQTYDVTELVTAGTNHLQGLLGNGWYRGQLVWPGNRSSYGDRLALLAQLELTFEDGSTQTIGTDGTWRACASGILFDDLYDGQRRDMGIANDPLGKESEPVDVLEVDPGILVAPLGPPVRIIETIAVREIFTSPSGATLVDFGQNLVGWVRLRVRGARAGDRVVIRHAEVLEQGELGTRPLRSARATSEYLLSGLPEEELQPTFTFNGFRYAEITGVDDLRIDDLEALVIGSELERTGWFESSDHDLNRLHENVVWSMRGNFLDVPTDCPQRDERLGWTGDIQVFAPSASYLFDTAGFLANWLQDLAAEQKPDGGVPYVIPDVLRETDPGAAGWSDAATLVPDALYRAYADRGMLERQYDSMKAWVDKVIAVTGESRLWDSGFQFGDWLDPTAPPDDAAKAQADKYVVATAYFAQSVRALSSAAATIGRQEDAADYAAVANEIVAAFNHEYVTPAGRILSDCQTVYALALGWHLLDSDEKERRAGDRLAELVREAEYRVSTGFLGTPLILDALALAGHTDLAYRMLLERECPSWLYAVSMGATTVWERWDSMLPDGSINPGEMTSFNHYAYGAVVDWLHRSVGGIAPAEPGYRRVVVRPLIPQVHDGDEKASSLTHASVRHRSPYGEIASSWLISDLQFQLTVELPYGVTGEVWLPGADSAIEVGLGRHEFVSELQR